MPPLPAAAGHTTAWQTCAETKGYGAQSQTAFALCTRSKAELRMVQRVQDEGRAMVLAANKMDLLSPAERNSFAKKLSETLAVRAPAMAGTLGETWHWHPWHWQP